MIELKLDPTREKCWLNFVNNIRVQGKVGGLLEVRDALKEHNALIAGASTIRFETEKDLMWFLLRWA